MTAESVRSPMPFLFVCCQAGAEATVKSDLVRESSQWRLAFSRPGFVTFKLPPNEFHNNPQLKSAFARTYGWSIGRTEAGDISAACDLLLGQRVHHIHVWPRLKATISGQTDVTWPDVNMMDTLPQQQVTSS